jgi:hypothetical protein
MSLLRGYSLLFIFDIGVTSREIQKLASAQWEPKVLGLMKLV